MPVRRKAAIKTIRGAALLRRLARFDVFAGPIQNYSKNAITVDERRLFEVICAGVIGALDILNVSCRLHDHALGARTESMLMKGMPTPSDNNFRMCNGRKDAGPSDEIQEVRRLEPGPLVPYVIVSRSWAIAEWYGGGGGTSLWSKHDGRWSLVQGGGGGLGTRDMRTHGVPESDWCKFGAVDAKCH